MDAPGKLTGSNPLAGWLNKLRDFCISGRIVEGVGYRLNRTTRGTFLDIESSRGAGARILQFLLVSIENDFYSCYEWSGTAAGTEEVYIARPFEHMVSNFNGRTISYNSDGDMFDASFSYESPTKRIKSISGSTETQVLVPYFKTGFTILEACEVGYHITSGPSNTPLTDPNGDPITLIELNRAGRAWAKI